MNGKRLQDLFLRYVDLCNRALDLSGGKSPYKALREAVRLFESNQGRVSAHVRHFPASGNFLLGIQDGRIVATPLKWPERAAAFRGRSWTVTRKYLETVLNDPQTHLVNPALIDWEWLQTPSPSESYLSAQGKFDVQAEQEKLTN